MIKAYFFDWMGTLGSYEDVINFKEVLTKDEMSLLLTTANFEDLKLEDKKGEVIFDALNRTDLSLYEDSIKTIERLSKENYKLCLVSNTYCVTPDRLRNLFKDIFNYFDVITFSSDVGLKKPDPRIFTYTLNKLNKIFDTNIEPREVIMVGDKKDKDVDPPLELGMNAILINRDNGSTLEDVLIR